MRILLDSNVLLRSVEPKHAQHQASIDAIDALRKLGHDLAIVPQVLYEFWSVATRPDGDVAHFERKLENRFDS